MNFKCLKVEHLWVIATIGTCFAYTCLLPIEQYDFWHYLKTGEITFHTHKLVDKDIFTFTVFDKPYINLHWLSQIIYYTIYKIGDLELLAFIHALVITISFLIIFLIALHEVQNLKIASWVTLISFFLSISNFALRPQTFSILFFALIFYLLKKDKLFYIPFIFLLWVNTHGGFVFGLVLLTAYWLGTITIDEKYHHSPKHLKVLILSALTTLFTPWGLKLYPTLLNAESQNLASIVSEWAPPSLRETTGLLFFTSLIGLVILQNFSKTKWSKTEFITFLVFTILALRSQRSVIWWAIITVPIFANSLSGVNLFAKISKSKEETNSRLNLILVVIFFIYITLCLPWTKLHNPLLPELKRNLISLDTPVLISNEVRKLSYAKRIFNSLGWSSYFMWSIRDDQKLFITPWFSIFPKNIINEYFLVSNGYSDWEDILNKYKIDTLVLSKNDQALLIPLATKSKHWKQLYEDSLGIIFVKS